MSWPNEIAQAIDDLIIARANYQIETSKLFHNATTAEVDRARERLEHMLKEGLA